MVQKRVGVVTVTYGDRGDYIKKTLENLFLLPLVQKIVVVTNGVSKKSSNTLNLLQKSNTKLIIHELGYNSGSAKGFQEGISRLLQEGIEYIWLIDDDNVPKPNALNELISSWNIFNPHNNPLITLLSYRPDREVYKQAIQNSNPYLMLGSKNSFLGFNLIIKLKNTVTKQKKNTPLTKVKHGEVVVAPYGGMFFHKTLIDKIGLPDERFFLYADDHEFSYRITKNGGKIILILDSELEDLETSFHLKKPKKILHTRYFSTNSKNAIYYSVRNNVYFEKNFVSSKFIYFLNKLSYIFILFLAMILNPTHFWKFPIILKAILSSSKHFKTNDKIK